MTDPHIEDVDADQLKQMLMGALEAVIKPNECLITERDQSSFTVSQISKRGDEVLKQFIVRIEQEV
jgi:hypothetical protein